jgi:hypothetical protein
LCEKFQIKQSTLATIIQNESNILEDHEGSSSALKTKRSKSSAYKEVDKALLLWLRQKRFSSFALDGDMHNDKSTEFAKSFWYEDAEIGLSLVDRWKIWHNIFFQILSGERNAVDATVVDD